MTGCPIPGAQGTQSPTGLGTSGVLLLGEAMGDHERLAGTGFVEDAPAGSVLERAIKRSGFRREQFIVWNLVPTQPPNNYLEGAPYEAEAIAWGLDCLDDVMLRYRPRVVLCLGGLPFKALTGLDGIMECRGFPVAASRYPGVTVLGTLHPSFLRRGAMAYMGVLMHDLKFAVALAATSVSAVYTPDKGLHSPFRDVEFWSPVLWRQVHYDIPFMLSGLNEPVIPPDYCCFPHEQDAMDFLRYTEQDASRLVAYDIETNYSPGATEDKSDELEDDAIISIQFSMAASSGIFMPWRSPFVEIARAILETHNPKVGANNWRFDDARLRASKCEVRGTRHDIRWAWKHLQPDLSGGLQFVTSFYAPELAPWKHLSKSHPQVYGIRDVDALMRIV